MNDEELLLKYKKYIKKRNITIVLSLLLFSIIISVLLLYLPKIIKEKEQPSKAIESISEAKDKPPVLELTNTEIVLEVNNEINYESYIKSAVDEIDGDLTKNVQYSKIDTSKVGEYKVLYYVFDASNNVTQKFLKVIISEPPRKEESLETKEEPSNQEEQEKPNTSTENKKPFNNNEEQKPQQNQNPSSSKPSTKYFLFEDGYTINNVVDACAKELKSYNISGRCEPITDENGIYLGMKLEFD